MIPHIIHHIWTSGDPLPDPAVAARQTWIDSHPSWEFRVWRPEDLNWLRNRALFDRAETYAQKADIARYEVVHRYGGVYLDTDMECLRPLDPLLEGSQFFAARVASGVVAIGIFGASPSHPILREVIERIPARCLLRPGEPIDIQTGPVLFDKVLRDGAWEERAGIRIFPPAFFYPYDHREPWKRDGTFPHAFAIHHWNHSWKYRSGLKANPTDLLPRRGEGLPPMRALWREGVERALSYARERVVMPTKGLVSRTAQRLIPPSPTVHGIPWGPREVLVATPFGTRLLCPNEDLSLAPELALTGTYDSAFVDFLGRRLLPGMTFVDVGANIGLFTVLGGSRVGPGGRVFAYECNPELVGYVRRNVEMNWFGDRVRLVPIAAHRDDEVRTFRVPRARKGLGSLTRFAGSVDQDNDLQEFQVACERLDVGLEDVPYIDLLKIDVEGGEAAVLDGAAGLLDQCRVGMISLEYRDDALREELREEMEKELTSLVQNRGAKLHVPGDSRQIPLDEALTVFHYPQLLVRFADASIEP